MLTLLGALLGFVSSIVPDVLKLFKDRCDRRHELTILAMQLKQQASRRSEHLEEIRIQGDVAESKALYQTYHSGVKWVDALNGTVRPVLAYAFFLLYAVVKLAAVLHLQRADSQPFAVYIDTLWSQDDAAVFAGIISFYFGQRAMSKVRG